MRAKTTKGTWPNLVLVCVSAVGLDHSAMLTDVLDIDVIKNLISIILDYSYCCGAGRVFAVP